MSQPVNSYEILENFIPDESYQLHNEAYSFAQPSAYLGT